MGLEYSNFNLLAEDFERLARSVEGPAADNALMKGADVILQHAIAIAPRGKSKNLVNGLGLGKIKTGKYGAKSITIGVHRKDFPNPKPDEYYPAYVEFGHGGPHPAGAQPFMQPAFDAEAENAYGIIIQELNQAINKIGE